MAKKGATRCAECGKAMREGPAFVKVDWTPDHEMRAVDPPVGWCSQACAAKDMRRDVLGHDV